MKTRKKLQESIKSRSCGGGLRGPEPLLTDTAKQKAPERVKDALKASRQFQLTRGGLVESGNGDSVPAIAFWREGFCVHVGEKIVRVWILAVQRKDGRYYYGIPAATHSKQIKLPGMDFNDEETRLLLDMADTVSGNIKKQEEKIYMAHPAADTIATQCEYWRRRNFDPDALTSFFIHTRLNLDILAATVDAQFPALGNVSGLPRGATAFIAAPSDDSGREYVRTVVGTATFTNEPGLFRSGVMELYTSDRKICDRYPERVAMVQVHPSGPKGVLPSILDSAAQADLSHMAGGPPDRIREEFPLILADEPIFSTFVLNIEIPDGLELPAGKTLDLLRAAASRLVQHETLEQCREKWKKRMKHPDAYRLNGFHAWRGIIKEHICEVLFHDSDRYKQVRNMAEHGIGELESVNQKRIAGIIGYYRHPEHYQKRIKRKSDISSDENRAVFEHRFSRGRNKGKNVIGFVSKEAVMETLEDAGLTPGLFPAFLREMRNLGMLLMDKDERGTLKVDVGGKKADCYVFLDPRFHGSEVPDQ